MSGSWQTNRLEQKCPDQLGHSVLDFRQFFFEGALLLLCFRAPASEPPASCCVLWSGKNRQTYCSVENQLLDSDCSELHDSMIFYAAAV